MGGGDGASCLAALLPRCLFFATAPGCHAVAPCDGRGHPFMSLPTFPLCWACARAPQVLGMVGLVTEGAKEQENFQSRMDKEAELAARVAAKKAAKAAEGKK